MSERWRSGRVVVLLALAGCGSTGKSSHGETQPKQIPAVPELEGFSRFETLGNACRAGLADAPADTYQALSFFPCRSGEADCQEPDWDGALRWDPVGTGDLLEYSLQLALDARGGVTRLLLTKQYPKVAGVDGIPHEAVVYALPGGEPLAALRNLGDALPRSTPNGSISGGSSSKSCSVMLGVTQDALVVVAAPSGAKSVLWGVSSYEMANEPPSLTPLEADPSVMMGPLAASQEVAGIVEDNGAVWRLDVAAQTALVAQGDMQRLWLDGTLGNDLLLRNLERTKYVALGADGAHKVAIEGTFLRGDAERLAWLVWAGDGVEVWSAPRDETAPADSAKLVASLPDVGSVSAVTIGDGTLAIQSDQVPRATLGRTLSLVNLDDGSVKSRTREDAGRFLLLANTATEAWVGEGAAIDLDSRQFERLPRLTFRK